jgi:two-component system, OmpR family, KDP operon response regulator KdpE
MNAAPPRVLVIDDEPPIRKLLRMGLSVHGYHVFEAMNGKTALELLGKTPDIIILDLGLPDIKGHDLLGMIRSRNEAVPVIVLSSRGDEAGKVQALDLGADDYVTKPFGMDELLARIRAALRHQLQTHGERPIFHVGNLSVDLVRRIVKVGDRVVKLTPKEYDLLRVLVQHAGKVLTHKFLLAELWGDLSDAQYLRVYVRQLRQKIEDDPEKPKYIHTETGIGYRLRAPDWWVFLCFQLCSDMNIKDFLSPTDVTIDVVVPNKQKLLFELASKTGARLRLPPNEIFAEWSKREELGSPGIGDGIAMPHARFRQVDKPFGLFLRVRQPIEFTNPVDIVFLLLLPEGAKGEQLSALACVARKLRNPAVTAALRKARDGAEIFQVLTSEWWRRAARAVIDCDHKVYLAVVSSLTADRYLPADWARSMRRQWNATHFAQMGTFMYRCPRTGLMVQGWIADESMSGGETYESVTCTACGRAHLINPKTGKIFEPTKT